MAEPDLDAKFAAAKAAVKALRRSPKHETAEQARRRSTEAIRLQRRLAESARAAVADAVAPARLPANGGNDNAPAGVLTVGVLRALAKGLVPFLNERLAETTAPIIARLAELEASALSDGGTWSAEKTFKRNSLVSYGGNVWIAQQPSSNVRPGDNTAAWRLVEKTRGRR